MSKPDDSEPAFLILPFESDLASLARVGGKGANLARLKRAGFPVPDGYLITTAAYRSFVDTHGIWGDIRKVLEQTEMNDPDALEAASAQIRAFFARAAMPDSLRGPILEAHEQFEGSPVAVRSSATAEDLPDFSFAGQQDTFLNVIQPEELLRAVSSCWSSLWTARAIGYRDRNGIGHQDVALAVVVQRMVESLSSGVLFTANPLTGIRTQTVIDAAFGLGEALVGGHVEPDHFVVETASGRILSKRLGAKAVAMRSHPGGGLETVEVSGAERQALTDEQIGQLADLGRRVARLYGSPQDIEWAWSDDQLHLLQSRPITSLFPLPEGMGPEPLRVLGSFGAVQGMLDPMTPLGTDAIKMIFAGGASILHVERTYQTLGFLHLAAGRLWGDLTGVMSSRLGRRLALRLVEGIEPASGQGLRSLLTDPRLPVGGPQFASLRRMAGLITMLQAIVRRNWADPDGRREQIIQTAEAELAEMRVRARIEGDLWTQFGERVELFAELFYCFPRAIPTLAAGAAAGLIPLALIHRMASHVATAEGHANLAMEISRGVPHNVTTEMDLKLWELAQRIRAEPASREQFGHNSAAALSRLYQAGHLSEPTQSDLERFLARYGMRGLAEIDFGRARWQDDPTQLLQTMKSYLQIEDPSLAPDAVFERGAAAAEDAIAALIVAMRKTFLGRLKVRLVKWAARRYRALAGLRESPKFYVIRMMGIVRNGLLASGEEISQAGLIEQPADLFFLYFDELQELARQRQAADWQAARNTIQERRQAYQRELRRKPIPRLLLSDGQAIYEGLRDAAGETAGLLTGSAVSPGVVEGRVRVVLDPVQSGLEPGEILVCPGTDPAWTPLFLAAAGLVMEVGGLMTHGSVVAREYGIPAVVGVHRATERLRTGLHVRVDGSSGRVEILD